MSYILNKLKKKYLNVALWIVQRHVGKQPNLFIYVYNRTSDTLIPITWKARGITQAKPGAGRPETNDWGNLDNLVNYRDKVVVDVGASLGATARHFSKRARIVHALEPHPDNYQFLEDQVRIRSIKNIVSYQLAASNQSGKVQFFGRESHGVHSLGVHNRGTVKDIFEVDSTKLDDFWRQNINEVIGLLKIDVEGFELEVLQGAADLLDKKMIEAVLFEFSPRIHRARKIDADAPISFLRKYGYRVCSLDGKDFNISPSKYPTICDLIAFPK